MHTPANCVDAAPAEQQAECSRAGTRGYCCHVLVRYALYSFLFDRHAVPQQIATKQV